MDNGHVLECTRDEYLRMGCQGGGQCYAVKQRWNKYHERTTHCDCPPSRMGRRCHQHFLDPSIFGLTSDNNISKEMIAIIVVLIIFFILFLYACVKIIRMKRRKRNKKLSVENKTLLDYLHSNPSATECRLEIERTSLKGKDDFNCQPSKTISHNRNLR